MIIKIDLINKYIEKMSNKLTIGQDTYDLDQYEYIHLYNFVAMMGWVKKIGLYKSGDILKSDNYDWVLHL